MKKMKKINWHIAIVYIVLTLYTLYTLYPIFLMMVTSLKNNLEIMKNPAGLPQEWVFDGFITLFQKENFGLLSSVFPHSRYSSPSRCLASRSASSGVASLSVSAVFSRRASRSASASLRSCAASSRA